MGQSSWVASWALAVGLAALSGVFADRGASAQAPKPAAEAARSRYNPAIFRGGAARVGDLGDLKLPATADLLWRIDFDSPIGNPVVFDEIVYAADDRGSLYAIKADGSAIIWQGDKPGRRFADVPAIVGERIYVATNQGLSALSRADGESLWDYLIDGGASESSPLVVGGRILVAGYDGFIHAVNADGSAGWKHDLVSDAPEPPPGFDQQKAVMAGHAARPRTMASDGTTVFAPIFDQSRVVAVDVVTGKRRWSFRSKGWMFAEPSVAGDDVFVTSQDQSLHCLDKATGRVRWSFPTRWRVESGVAVRDGSAYFGSCDGFFYAVDIKTGKARWSFETPKGDDGHHFPIYSSPIVSAAAICFGSFDGYLYALETADGSLQWKIHPVDGAKVSSSPSTDGRYIFASVRYDQFKKSGANSLIAVGVVKPK